jgi:RNA polymerase sigma-70 factor (ECF subfamily)
VTTPISQLRNDSELVIGAQAGDPQAMHDLLSLLRPAVLRFCRSRLGSYAGGFDLADDVAQETCVGVFHMLPRFAEQGVPFGAWVYAIAGNKVVDAQRRLSRATVPMDEVPEQVEPSPTPEDRVIATSLLHSTAELIDQLPERSRKVLLLRAGGACAESIGAELGLSAGAVRVLQHRAVAKLRRLVGESEEHRDLFWAEETTSAKPAGMRA